MNFFMLKKSQITNNTNSFLLNIAEHENLSANKYENAFSYLLAEKISCSAEFRMKKKFYNIEAWFRIENK